MAKAKQPSRLTHLDTESCRQLLAAHSTGRVAINADPSPDVLPVTYAVSDGAVLFRTAEGVKHIAAERGAAATFEVDGVDEERRSGWSVVVRGHLETVEPVPGEPERGPDPLPGGDRPHLVRLVIAEIEGRRFPPDSRWVEAVAGRGWSGPDASDLMG